LGSPGSSGVDECGQEIAMAEPAILKSIPRSARPSLEHSPSSWRNISVTGRLTGMKLLRMQSKFLSNFKLIWVVQIGNEKYFALSEHNPALEPAQPAPS
jgi:hypothetical protein